jgi:CelD/BcsL family acetyltransferase involved in cellulose biosynthesis
VTVARSEEEVEDLRDLWRSVGVTNVDADIDHFLAVVRHSPNVVRPHVVAIEREGAGPILVVARMVDQEYPLRVGYRVLARPSARTVVVSFDGVLGARSEQDHALVLDELNRCLREREADVVVFQKVETRSTLSDHIHRSVPSWRQRQGPATVRWTAKLPESWEALLAQRSSKSRRQIRYDDAKFARRYAGRTALRRLDLSEHRHRLEADLEEVAGKAYQRGLGVGTDGGPVQQALIRLSLERGWLRVWMLYVDEEPVAFWWGVAYQGVLTIGSPGYDPEFAKDRVGYFVLRRMLEDLCLDEAVTVIDFGHGDADYKERFGTEVTTSSDELLFAGRARPLLLQLAVSANSRLTLAAKAVLAHSAQAQGLKRRMRRRAASRGGPEAG